MNNAPNGFWNLPPRLEKWAPWLAALFKLMVSAGFLYYYIARFTRIMYIADGPARGIEAYRLAFGGFQLFPQHQFPPLPLWLWAAFLRIWPDIYFTGTILNVLAGTAVAAFLYLLGKQLAGSLAGIAAVIFYTFTPVHLNLTLSEGMAEPFFYMFLTAGIYLAARGETRQQGSWGALFCFAAAALSRYEAAAFLILYTGYALLYRRPRKMGTWVLWALPLALAGVFIAAKGFQPHDRGLWPALGGVHADTARVLKNPVWYRRLGYGFWRILYDGRAGAALGLIGAAAVFLPALRTRPRLFIWSGWALILGALVVIAVAVGIGFCPERYFATPLLLMYPFAGLALALMFARARTRPAQIAAAAVAVVALVVTAHWALILRHPGYGYGGRSETRATFAIETGLKLRDLWASAQMAPGETVLIETGPGANEEYPLRAYTNRPLNFIREPSGALMNELHNLTLYMAGADVRIGIILTKYNRELIKNYYGNLVRDAVIYETPTETIVVRKTGWREVPDFSNRVLRDKAVVIIADPDVPPPKTHPEKELRFDGTFIGTAEYLRSPGR